MKLLSVNWGNDYTKTCILLTGELYDADTRISHFENDLKIRNKQTNNTFEKSLYLERYSRDYNLRFYNVPKSTGEDCIGKLCNIIENDLGIQPVLENTHRLGMHRDDDSFHPILANLVPCFTGKGWEKWKELQTLVYSIKLHLAAFKKVIQHIIIIIIILNCTNWKNYYGEKNENGYSILCSMAIYMIHNHLESWHKKTYPSCHLNKIHIH